DPGIARANGQGVRFRRWQAGLEAPVHQQSPDLLVGDGADQVLDVDAAVAQRAALFVRLGDLGGEGDDAFQARLDLADGLDLAHCTRFLGSLLDGVAALWAGAYRRRNVHGGRLPEERPAARPVEDRSAKPRGGAVSDSNLMFRPATELARMVRSGEISATELVQTSLERIEELNPGLNAFVQVDAERALATAERIAPGDERPFAGVPVAIKN